MSTTRFERRRLALVAARAPARRVFLARALAAALWPAAAPFARAAGVTGGGGSSVFDETVASVIPEQGFQNRIRLGDSVMRLSRQGVIDASKFKQLYGDRGGLPPELQDVLTSPSEQPVHLTRQSANFYVNLLWPLGLSNFMAANERSPVKGESLFNFASTGGWTLGREANGGQYFNKMRAVELTPEQEALAVRVAESTYRPCCDNSTFFQDCNHGSALLGAFELGASQGLTEDELYREAVAFNSFWFPSNYIQIALYFKAVKGVDWANVDPKTVMGKDFSTASGNARIRAEVARIPDLIPNQPRQGGSCGVSSCSNCGDSSDLLRVASRVGEPKLETRGCSSCSDPSPADLLRVAS
jgi:hypothetical protein